MTDRRASPLAALAGPSLAGAERPYRWETLKTLIWVRLLVAALALPVGLLLHVEAGLSAWHVLGWALLATGAGSAVFWLGTVLRRGFRVQLATHLVFDLLLVTVVSAWTGGRNSQFVLFYLLVTLAGGARAGLAGGLGTAAAACVCYAILPDLAQAMGAPGGGGTFTLLPAPGMLVAVLVMLGVLAGFLGRGAITMQERLDSTSRELDRVRFDNDVILRHITSGVITLHSDGTIAYLNPAAEEVLGVGLEAVKGRPAASALPERLGTLRDALLEVLTRRRARARGELMMQTEGGQPLPIGISTNVLTHEDRVTGVVAIFTDLSAVREMEQRALRNQTLAEVGALAAGIAHELRNGLNPISGSVECLQRELRLDGENAQLMELIAKECVRLNRFVTDLLTYSKDRALVREAIDLDADLEEMCETLARDPRCGTGITVRFQPGAEASPLRADREQLRQVWLNLAINAIESMGERGVLTMRWHADESERVVVEFADNGPGITAEDLPRIGKPFFTTKQGGTGLGLAIAQRIVERHGGALAFESTPGQGAIARVTLPAEATVLAQAA